MVSVLGEGSQGLRVGLEGVYMAQNGASRFFDVFLGQMDRGAYQKI